MNTLVLIDIALAVLVIEAIVLLIWRVRGGSLPVSRIAAMSAAGLALLIALHAQAAGFPAIVIAAALACAGASHAVDLVQRLQDRAHP